MELGKNCLTDTIFEADVAEAVLAAVLIGVAVFVIIPTSI
jgi:hypothetical protein